MISVNPNLSIMSQTTNTPNSSSIIIPNPLQHNKKTSKYLIPHHPHHPNINQSKDHKNHSMISNKTMIGRMNYSMNSMISDKQKKQLIYKNLHNPKSSKYHPQLIIPYHHTTTHPSQKKKPTPMPLSSPISSYKMKYNHSMRNSKPMQKLIYSIQSTKTYSDSLFHNNKKAKINQKKHQNNLSNLKESKQILHKSKPIKLNQLNSSKVNPFYIHPILRKILK